MFLKNILRRFEATFLFSFCTLGVLLLFFYNSSFVSPFFHFDSSFFSSYFCKTIFSIFLGLWCSMSDFILKIYGLLGVFELKLKGRLM